MTDQTLPDPTNSFDDEDMRTDSDTGDGDGYSMAEDIRYESVEEALAATREFDDTDGGVDERDSADNAFGEDAPNADEDQPDIDAEDDHLVRLGDGVEVPLGELKRGYLRQQDYTRKTQDLARSRESIEAVHDSYADRAQSLQNAYRTLTNHLEGLLPPAPDPSMAEIDPERYQAELDLRDAAFAELQALQQTGDAFDTEFGEAIAEEGARYREREEASLKEALPFLADPARRAAFDAANRETALDFGFSEDEIARTADHRILQLVHYARIGRQAEIAGRDVARRFAGTPRRGQRGQPASGHRNGSSAAMRRFQQTGSFEDAMKVDFID